MRTRAIIPVVLIAAVAVASPARAQIGAFAGGGAATTSIWFSHAEERSPVILSTDTSGRVGEWFIVGGGTVARHAVLQAEFTSRQVLEKDIPPPKYPTPGPSGTEQHTMTYRFRDIAFLAGYTTGSSHRVNVTALAGVMFIQTRITDYTLYTPPPGSPPYPIYPSDSTVFDYSVAPAFGLDVPITVASHVLVVPQVRTWKIPGGGPLALSTGASARITF